MSFEIFHTIEFVAVIFLLYMTYRASRCFRLIIWKWGWYSIAAAGTLLAFSELGDIFVLGFEGGMFAEIMNVAVILLLTAGVFMLSRVATQLWGKK